MTQNDEMHRALDDLRLRRADGGRALRQRRPQPDRGPAGDAWSCRERTRRPICGKDYKTGQTLIKTILAPGFKARMLGLNGWFSTNILGNRDGEVLEDPGVVQDQGRVQALGAGAHPAAGALSRALRQVYHKVRINYYPPRGDNKEGWDNIDIFGWLGYPMQIKVDFLCRDSILAAPLVLDLVLFLDLAQRSSNCAGWVSRSG